MSGASHEGLASAPAWSSISDAMVRQTLGWAYDLGIPLAEREPLPGWMRPELVRTIRERSRLSAWAQRTPRDRWDEPPTPDDLMLRIEAYGDEYLLTPLVDVLKRLPPPVRDHALDACGFILVGRVTRAWIGGAIRVDKPFTVVLSACRSRDQFEFVAAHELCHAWQLDEPTVPIYGALYESALKHSDHVPTDFADRARAVRSVTGAAERAVDVLCEALGFQPPADWNGLPW